jgi:3-hydroxybutyryl-CoA dehydrogenase
MRVGLLGYGKMGRGIFSLLAESPLRALVYVRDPAKADDNNRKLEKRLRRGVSSGLVAEAELPARLAAYRFTSDLAELSNCELCIESVTEDWDLKVRLLRQVEELLPDSAVLSTNSSSFSPTKLSAQLRRPEQFCGFHFFHPVQLTSIIEIIVGERTAPAAVAAVREASLAMKRRPIVVKDYSGSAINVILTGLTCEALYILEQGAALPSRIDGITARISRLGPCEAVDTIGVAFFTEVLQRTLKEFPFKFTMPDLLHKLIRDGRDGKYAGKGLFLYRDDRPYDDDASYYVNPQQTHSPAGTPTDDDSLLERIMLQVYYCTLFLAEMGIGTLDDFCFGIQDLIGLQNNPLDDIRRIGGDRLTADLERLQATFGDRYDPAPIARMLAQVSG